MCLEQDYEFTVPIPPHIMAASRKLFPLLPEVKLSLLWGLSQFVPDRMETLLVGSVQMAALSDTLQQLWPATHTHEHIHTHTHKHTHTHTHTHINTHIHTHTQAYSCANTQKHVCIALFKSRYSEIPTIIRYLFR